MELQKELSSTPSVRRLSIAEEPPIRVWFPPINLLSYPRKESKYVKVAVSSLHQIDDSVVSLE